MARDRAVPEDGAPGQASVWSSAGSGARAEGLGSLADVLDRILCKGVTVHGAVTIGVAGVELLLLDLRLLLAAIDTVRPEGSFFSGAADGGPAGPAAPRRPPPVAPPRAPTAPAAASDGPLATEPDWWQPSSTAAAALAGTDAPDRKGPQQGLIRLVLTLVNLLHEVLERQAVRRMGNGTLTPEQIEDVGTALYAQAMEITRLRQQFGLSETDLTLRLSAAG